MFELKADNKHKIKIFFSLKIIAIKVGMIKPKKYKIKGTFLHIKYIMLLQSIILFI